MRDPGAFLAVVTSTAIDPGYHGIGTHLSIAMALEGKRVCIIRPERPNTAPEQISSTPGLDELITDRGSLDRLLQPAPAGIRILYCDDWLQRFDGLSPEHQLAIVGILQHLEMNFDCLLLEIPASTSNLPVALLRSAPLLVLGLTTDEASLTDSFRTLQSLHREPLSQTSYVLVDTATSLPQAHGAFKRFQHAASRYLGTDPHYLGYIPSPRHEQRSLQQAFETMMKTPESPFDRSLHAISERFCRAVTKTGRSNALSEHFRQRRQSAALAARKAPEPEPPIRESGSQTPATEHAHRTDARLDNCYRTAMKFAMRLGASRPRGTDKPKTDR
jgi:flagellar biosynthesis protein FlhG